METVHEIIRESVSGGFLKFAGYYTMIILLLGIPASIIIVPIRYWLRHRTLLKHGYPPTHCDADGDQLEESSKSSDK